MQVLFCKPLTNNQNLPNFLLEVTLGFAIQSERWEVGVLPLCHHGYFYFGKVKSCILFSQFALKWLMHPNRYISIPSMPCQSY